MDVVLIKDSNKIIGPNKWALSLVLSLRKIGVNSEILYVSNLRFYKNIKLIKKNKIIHFFVPSPQTLFYLLISKIYYKKTIFTLHGYYDIEAEKKPFYKKYLWVILNELFIKWCNTVTTPSIKLKNYVDKKKIRRKKIVTIPNGILYDENKKFSITKKKYLIYVTNFDHYNKCKGIINVVEAFRLLNKKKKNLRLLVVGGGKYKRYFEKKINIKNIKFLGYRKDLKEIIEKCEALIYISYLDVFPMILLETMNLGKFFVVNNVGGVKEILGNELKDLLIRTKPDEIKNKLVNYINKSYSQKKEIFQRIRNRSKYFDSEFIADKFLKIYLKQ